jgi:2-polyprenyl-3-methyl-5-hydroxy-6-metoxy-1,4-benzoquinol methylase
MSYKNKPLLPAEIQISKDNFFYKELLALSDRTQKNITDLRVLDWGCGRGRYVGFLLSQGINAYGVDIDQNVISQAKNLFEQNSWDFNQRLKVIPQDNKTNFPEGFFDYILSDQVIEHVRDLSGLAQELTRITKSDGIQVHRWPAKFRVFEPHLFMPFVHWVPKGILRYSLILFYVVIGKEPRWEHLKGKSIWKKAKKYSEYSHQKTYYRTLSTIGSLFKNTWKVEFVPNISFRYNLVRKIAVKLKLDKILGLNFHTVIMKLKNDQ